MFFFFSNDIYFHICGHYGTKPAKNSRRSRPLERVASCASVGRSRVVLRSGKVLLSDIGSHDGCAFAGNDHDTGHGIVLPNMLTAH